MINEKHEAYLNGYHAHRLKVDLSQNPYDVQTQRFSYARWIEGWCSRFADINSGVSNDFSTQP